jgi:sugar phosphate isomerase/epimerase
MGPNEHSISRREALLLVAAAPAATRSALAGPAQAAPPASESAPGEAPALTLVSRHLQWTDAESGIEIARSAGFAGIAWTVRPGAHVVPETVERDLPRIVALTRKAGLATPMIITGIGNVGAPKIEAILETMKSLGIRRYRAVAPKYDYTRDLEPQFAAFRSAMIALSKLNERYDTTAMFHTHSYANTIGGSAWDLWMLLKDLDPRYIGINYDIGHVMAKGGDGWRESSRAAHRHIQALSVKDFHWVKRTDAPAGEWSWRTEFVPPGQGMVNFSDFFQYFRSIDFTGPIETYCEYKVEVPGVAGLVDMLGKDFGKWQLEMPRNTFLGYLKRDAAFYKSLLQTAGFKLNR